MNRRFALFLVVTVLAAVAAGLYFQTRRAVTVRVADHELKVLTHAATVGGVLRDAGLALETADRFYLGAAATPLTDTAAALLTDTVVTLERARWLRLDADATTRWLRVQPAPAQALLSAAGLLLYPGDELWADGARVEPAAVLAVPPAHLAVRRAVPVTIAAEGEPFTLQTAARTVGEALWQAGLRLRAGDRVDPAPGAAVSAHLRVTVTRAQALSVQADGRTLTSYSQAATVGQALAEAGLPLAGADYSVPAADQPRPADGLIRVVRVREEVLSEQTLIPRETVYQALPEVDIDTVQTLQAGADGLRRRLVRVRYEDGVEVSRVAEAETIAQAPEPRVIGYGAKITVRVVDTPDGPLEYWRAYTVYATSYSASRAGVPRTARNFGITASGRPLVRGLIAVDRRYIPFGTRLYVPGYGFALAADTGGGVKGRFIDLGYDDWNYQHWSQVVTLYFLTPVPPADQIAWIIPSTVP